MTFGSLRLRLLLAAGAFVLAAMALATLGLTYLFESHVERWINTQLDADLDQLVGGIGQDASGKINVAQPPTDPRFDQPLSGIYWQVQVDPDGPVIRSRSLWDFVIALPEVAAFDGTTRHHVVDGPAGQSLYLLQRKVVLPPNLGGKNVRAGVGLDDRQVRLAVRRFASALFPFLLVLAILLTAAAWMQVLFGLRPLKAMRRRLAQIGSGDQRRLGSGFPDEVQPLAQEIDALLDVRDEQVETARARAADLAHGLKTPLQALSGEAQRLRAKGEDVSADAIEEISSVMQRHVDRNLARARMAVADPGAKADVADIVSRIVRVLERTPKGARLIWEIDVPEGLVARIDAEDLTEALGGLLENAVRHARTRVRVFASRQDGFVRVTIADDGDGIPRERHSEALRRGGRLDLSGPGEGLGLAIVRDIADVWGAALALDTRNGEFWASLRLPCP